MSTDVSRQRFGQRTGLDKWRGSLEIFKVAFVALLLHAIFTVGLPWFLLLSTGNVAWTRVALGPAHWLGLIICGFGVYLYVWAVARLVVRQTSALPLQAASALETDGWYSVVRHPLLLGVVLILLGEALLFESVVLLMYGCAYWLGVDTFVARPEEIRLHASFGDSYGRYHISGTALDSQGNSSVISMNDVDVAISVADAGATLVRSCFGTALERVDKGGGDFATNADIEAENAMLAVLQRERPEDAVLGEESGRTGAADGARTWLLDPLCGTLNYAVKMRVVAVNVALRVGNRFVAAAIADPFNHEVYWADTKSAWVRIEGRDTSLRPDAVSRLVDLNLDPPFPNAPGFRAVTLAADPGFTAVFRPRVVSTSVALAWVETGQRAAYVTDGDVRDSVHFAAGLALCEAAGCVVTDLWGQPWGVGPTGLLAAADSNTHAALLGLARKYLS